MPGSTQKLRTDDPEKLPRNPAYRQQKATTSGRLQAASYAVTILLSAFLLSQVQLIMGKLLLPRFGGGPWVWSTSLLVFQLLLLTGYGYAAFLCTRFSPRLQGIIHLVLLLSRGAGLAVVAMRLTFPFPIGRNEMSTSTDNPVWRITLLLLSAVGAQCLLLSSTSPLLQNWFNRRFRTSPYRLYALSNLGSVLALLSYPVLVERLWALSMQGWIWNVGYGAFLIAAGTCAVLSIQDTVLPEAQHQRPSKVKIQKLSQTQPVLIWLALAACSSMMLLATTNLICQQVAPVPLLWVVPLSLYLLSFILCFDHSRWYRREIFCPVYLVTALLALKFLPVYSEISVSLLVGIFCAALSAVCIVCHGELARAKPEPQHLTLFYLMVGAGGALGSAVVVLLAPHIFDRYWEFQIALLGCGILGTIALLRDRRSWIYSLQLGGIILTAAVLTLVVGAFYFTNELLDWEGRGDIVISRSRNFFGVKTVLREQDDVTLVHGHTLHGLQYSDPARRGEPTIYFGRESGVGLLLEQYPRVAGRPNLRVGIIGMGVGTLAAYGKTGDYFRFYEIDPAIVDLSRGDQPTFSFVQGSQAQSDAVLGDARIVMQEELAQGEQQQFDVLVVDAFSGDTIPVHLLTREAMELYLRYVRGPECVVAFHLSNSALDLRPVVESLARTYHMNSLEFDTPPTIRPTWILLANDPAVLRLPVLAAQGHPVDTAPLPQPWTDQFSNLYQLLHW
jgi:hypothetical protein